MNEKRKRIWIDGFQTQLSWRIALYSVAYQVAAFGLFLFWGGLINALESATHSRGPLLLYVLAPVFMLALAAAFIYESIKLTHRIVGPIYRFRKVIKALVAGEEVALITLRNDDFLVDFRDDMNALLKHLERQGVVVLKEPQAQLKQAVPA